jgi:hypothetical protein
LLRQSDKGQSGGEWVQMTKRKIRDAGQKIIKNMGLFWDFNSVRWRGNRGIGAKRLIGQRATAKLTCPVFSDHG